MAQTSFLRRSTRMIAAGGLLLLPSVMHAAIFQGGGLSSGLQYAAGIAGLSHNSNARSVIGTVLVRVMEFSALMGVIAVVVAGLYLILGFGNDNSQEKARKIIFYTLIGLVIILFARLIVGLATNFLPSITS